MEDISLYSKADRRRRETEAIAPLLGDFDLWARAARLRHPVKVDQAEAWVYMRTVFENPEKRALFSENHNLWCDTPLWKKEGGRHAPTLTQFIRNEAYRHPPGPVYRRLDLSSGTPVFVEARPFGDVAEQAKEAA